MPHLTLHVVNMGTTTNVPNPDTGLYASSAGHMWYEIIDDNNNSYYYGYAKEGV